MTTESIIELEQLGRIVVQLKMYQKTHLAMGLDTPRDQYLRQHLTVRDWLFWRRIRNSWGLEEDF